jgi:hypothetical protein
MPDKMLPPTQISTSQDADKVSRRLFFDRYKDLKIYDDANINEFGADLIGRFHYTMGARYEAARRLGKKSRISILSILILTFYSMFFSMISTMDKIVDVQSKDLCIRSLKAL